MNNPTMNLDNSFADFVSNPRWISTLSRYARDFDNHVNILKLFFSASIEHQHREFMISFLWIIQDENFKRQLFLEKQAENLLAVLQTNNVDLIHLSFDYLNNAKSSEVSQLLVLTCERWIKFIQQEALEVLFEELALPVLLEIHSRLQHKRNAEGSQPPHGEQLLKHILDQKLAQYIDSIDKGQRRGFCFFKQRQTENRQINYELAKKLREKLTTESTSAAFSNIYHLRHQIRQTHSNAPWFNFINSRELNDIIALSHHAKSR